MRVKRLTLWALARFRYKKDPKKGRGQGGREAPIKARPVGAGPKRNRQALGPERVTVWLIALP